MRASSVFGCFLRVYVYLTLIDDFLKANASVITDRFHDISHTPRLDILQLTTARPSQLVLPLQKWHPLQLSASSGPKTHDQETHPVGHVAGASSTSSATEGQISMWASSNKKPQMALRERPKPTGHAGRTTPARIK